MPRTQWVAVLPVKDLAVAKSRLAVPARLRAALALAMARDVVAAATAAEVSVLVVTDDPRAGAVGATWTEPDVPRAGLSAALRHGADLARRYAPGAGVVALTADLPALQAESLAAVLAAAGLRAVVADADGIGTVLLAAPPGIALDPAYEGRSFEAHRRSGAVDLTATAAPGLRRDVDTVADLAAARDLGLGPATTAALAADADAWRAAGLDRGVHLGL